MENETENYKEKEMGIKRSSKGQTVKEKWGLNYTAKKERERNIENEQNRRKINRLSLEERDRNFEKKKWNGRIRVRTKWISIWNIQKAENKNK